MAGKTKIFHTQIGEGIYQLSSSEFGYSREFGKASRSSYLVVGRERALLFDLALKEKNLVEYAAQLAAKPIQIVISHAHVDHIFHANKTEEVWLHQKDEQLFRKGTFFQRGVKPCPQLKFLSDGDEIDLGERVLDVIHIPGHTDGSILLLDRNTKILLSGDTVTRRLLYGLHTYVPLKQFCDRLSQLNEKDFEQIYTAHDRAALPKSHINYMRKMLLERMPKEYKLHFMIPFGKILCFTDGVEEQTQYFDLAMPAKHYFKEAL